MIKNRTIHCMGIGGSALSGVALIAQKKGYKVSGCDKDGSSPYIAKLKRRGIEFFKGHSEDHIINSEIVIVSPAILYQNPKHPEVVRAREEGKLMLWEEFVGEKLLGDTISICIAGTHGKSTTTGMAGLLLEKAKLDPTVIIGATVKEWRANYRVGAGNYTIIEADEFYEKYLHYKPQYILLNNIEYDHPDFFASRDDVIESFRRFVMLLSGAKKLIINQDSEGVAELFGKLPKDFLASISVIGYSLSQKPKLKLKETLKAEIVKETESETEFQVKLKNSEKETITLKVPGRYNVSNALGVIVLGGLLKIPIATLKSSLTEFNGVGRRMELLGNIKGITLYDDYAHHPTAIRVTLKALRQKYPKNRIWVIVEPHSFSRTKALLTEYKNSFSDADKVIIAPIFPARDSEMFGVTGQSIVDIAGHDQAIYLPSFEDIVKLVKSDTENNDVIIVMGAGKSQQLSKLLKKELQV